MFNQTERLIIRPFEGYDVPILKKWFYSGDYPEFFRDMLALNDEQLKVYSFLKDGQGFMIFENGGHSAPIGFVVLYEQRIVPANIKLSILIDKKVQKKGLCLEAMREMCRYVFGRMRVHKLIVEALETNDRLNAMLEKGGFMKECVLLDEASMDGCFYNVCRYALFKKDFPSSDIESDRR